jgi:hypothetical protein
VSCNLIRAWPHDKAAPMSKSPFRGRRESPPVPANDNDSRLRAVVLIPANSPVTQVEIEVFSALLEGWDGLAANDNEEQPK